MNERDKHLSEAIDDLTELRRLLVGLEPIHKSSRVVHLATRALGHCEDAADMPKPARFKIIRRFWKEAA